MMRVSATRPSTSRSGVSASGRRSGTVMTMRIGPPSFRNTRSARAMKKAQLLVAIEPLQRGLLADEDTVEAIDKLASELERMNPTKEPLNSELLSGKWELKYTTSASILGKKRKPFLRPKGPIYQTIDAASLKAKNQESGPLFNAVEAALTPKEGSVSEVDVQFTWFKILGLLPFKAPASAKGSLDTTFLDEDLRISRGDKGNLFVLLMEDPSVRLK